MVNYYIFALCSLLAGAICLFFSRSKRYSERVEKSYGEAAARKMTRSLRIWGYFLLTTSAVLILALIFERAR
jgi:hypothetical protein